MWGETGLGRLLSDEIGGQIGWLLPTALLLLVAGLWFTRRAARTDLRPGEPGALGRVAGRHRGDVQLHGRDLPRLLHGGPGPRDRRPGRHRRLAALAAPHLAARLGSGQRGGVAHDRARASSCSAGPPTSCRGCAGWCCWPGSSSRWPSPASAGCPAGRGGPRRGGARGLAGRARRRTPSRPRPRRTPARSPAPVRRPPAGSVAAARGGAPPAACRRGTQGAPAAGRRRTARRQRVHGRDHRAAAGGRRPVHLGGRRGRLQLGVRLPAGQRGAGDGDRRLQRLRPVADAGAVPGVRRGRRDPLLHRRRRLRRRWRPDGRQQRQQRDRRLGRGRTSPRPRSTASRSTT